MRDLRLQLKPEHCTPFNHGWLAAHFGWKKDPLSGGIVNLKGEASVSEQQLKCQREGWLDGYQTAVDTPFERRCIALSRLVELEFE
jgi:hypothetical protein